MGKGDNYIDGGTTKYELNLIYLLDTSGSMIGEPINQLNVAMAEAVEVAKEAALEKEVDLRMRVVEFNTTAHWLFGDEKSGETDINWRPLSATGGTDTAGAIYLACKVMHREYLGVRNYRPVVILITDGESNDPQATREAVERLKDSLKSSTEPGKDKITRIAIGVKGANRQELLDFASVGNIVHDDTLQVEENVPFVFDVDNIEVLRGVIRTITVSSIASSLGAGVGGGDDPQQELVLTKDTGDSAADDDGDWAE